LTAKVRISDSYCVVNCGTCVTGLKIVVESTCGLELRRRHHLGKSRVYKSRDTVSTVDKGVGLRMARQLFRLEFGQV
jgi:hypothetical protein